VDAVVLPVVSKGAPSAVYILKQTELGGEPCGIPELTSDASERHVSNIMRHFLSLRIDGVARMSMLDMPLFSTLPARMSISTHFVVSVLYVKESYSGMLLSLYGLLDSMCGSV
jgi:hypothetical protein